MTLKANKKIREETIDDEKEDWMTRKWRPMMAITYMSINIADFILFPVLFTLVQFWESGTSTGFRQWVPMTLQGGGFIHMAFGAILGITAWTRGIEKVARTKAAKSDYDYDSQQQE